jgi:hypothetical protein
VIARVAATHGSPIRLRNRLPLGAPGQSREGGILQRRSEVAKRGACALDPLTVSALLSDATNWVNAKTPPWATHTAHRRLNAAPWECCFHGTQKGARKDNGGPWCPSRRHQAAVPSSRARATATSRTLPEKHRGSTVEARHTRARINQWRFLEGGRRVWCPHSCFSQCRGGTANGMRWCRFHRRKSA